MALLFCTKSLARQTPLTPSRKCWLSNMPSKNTWLSCTMLAYTCYYRMFHSDGDISSLTVSRRPTVAVLLERQPIAVLLERQSTFEHHSQLLVLFSVLIIAPIIPTADGSSWGALLHCAPTRTRLSTSCSTFGLRHTGKAPTHFIFQPPLPMLYCRAKLLAAASIARRGGVGCRIVTYGLA